MKHSQGKFLNILLGIWLLSTLSGFAYLNAYEKSPAPAGPTASDWPSRSKIDQSSDKATMVVFLHPHCPCSRATLDAIKEILKNRSASIQINAVFVVPPEVQSGWEESPLLEECRSIPGIVTSLDFGGKESNLFGAKTSGDVFIFNSQGKVIFSGGITNGRGQVWTDRERETFESALTSPNHIEHAPTYGCALL